MIDKNGNPGIPNVVLMIGLNAPMSVVNSFHKIILNITFPTVRRNRFRTNTPQGGNKNKIAAESISRCILAPYSRGMSLHTAEEFRLTSRKNVTCVCTSNAICYLSNQTRIYIVGAD
jgi:hypothetical protein